MSRIIRINSCRECPYLEEHVEGCFSPNSGFYYCGGTGRTKNHKKVYKNKILEKNLDKIRDNCPLEAVPEYIEIKVEIPEKDIKKIKKIIHEERNHPQKLQAFTLKERKDAKLTANHP